MRDCFICLAMVVVQTYKASGFNLNLHRLYDGNAKVEPLVEDIKNESSTQTVVVDHVRHLENSDMNETTFDELFQSAEYNEFSPQAVVGDHARNLEHFNVNETDLDKFLHSAEDIKHELSSHPAVWDYVLDVEGHHTRDGTDSPAMACLARALLWQGRHRRSGSPVRTIETGFAEGYSAVALLAAAIGSDVGLHHSAFDPAAKTVYEGRGLHRVQSLLDAFGHSDVQFNLVELSAGVGLSQLMEAHERVDVAFMDDGHRFDDNMVELYFINKLMEPAGVLLIHDFDMPSVQSTSSFIESNLPFARLAKCGRADVFIKTGVDTRNWDHYIDFKGTWSRHQNLLHEGNAEFEPLVEDINNEFVTQAVVGDHVRHLENPYMNETYFDELLHSADGIKNEFSPQTVVGDHARNLEHFNVNATDLDKFIRSKEDIKHELSSHPAVWDYVLNVEGHHTSAGTDSPAMACLARALLWQSRHRRSGSPVRTIETGFAEGYSTVALLAAAIGSDVGLHHSAFDPYAKTFYKGRGLHRVQSLLDAFGHSKVQFDFVELSAGVGLSHIIKARGSVDVAFMDDGHLFDDNMAELYFINKLMEPGGVLLIHDFHMPSVRSTSSFIESNLPFARLKKCGRADVFIKTGADTRKWDHYVDFTGSW